ncbi:MAG: uL15 family ribosomal protein [Candidatus Marsarchaeota archaeon]|jgi:large subunit ribosomal protein L15|nr:uL15 family ribosomal protein [Candidatus Marsarchaeota archaeon]
MVVRKEKRNRKYFGTRRWGVGNIKNARGAGDRGGVGNGRRKHRFTYFTAKHPELIGKKGFHVWKPSKLKCITLYGVNRIALKAENQMIDLSGYRVVSNGELEKSKLTIKAAGFSKKAMEKIKNAECEAVVM